MRILVDADSCGKVRTIARIGKELKVPIILYHDDSHEIESCDDYESKVIPHGKDAVDFAILRDCKKNDVVITQDTGLASLVLAMNAFCIHPKGFCFTNQNIMSLLTTRYLNTQYKKGRFLVDANEPDGKLILTKNQDTPCSDSECDRDWPEFVMFMLNALLYLCSENAEIRENAVTKNTYRPSNRVRNRFSEIRKMDCGFVYGSEVRKHRKAHVEQQKECKSRETTSIRHAMRPHTRKAHWHHYWVGKGRKELVLRWIAPTVVGTGERVATIHRVRNGELKRTGGNSRLLVSE